MQPLAGQQALLAGGMPRMDDAAMMQMGGMQMGGYGMAAPMYAAYPPEYGMPGESLRTSESSAVRTKSTGLRDERPVLRIAHSVQFALRMPACAHAQALPPLITRTHARTHTKHIHTHTLYCRSGRHGRPRHGHVRRQWWRGPRRDDGRCRRRTGSPVWCSFVAAPHGRRQWHGARGWRQRCSTQRQLLRHGAWRCWRQRWQLGAGDGPRGPRDAHQRR